MGKRGVVTLMRCVWSMVSLIIVGALCVGCSDIHVELPPRNLSLADTAPVDLADVSNGGTVTIALEKWIANFNYHHTDGGTLETHMIEDALFPSAFYAHDDGSLYYRTDYFTDIHDTFIDGFHTLIYTINPRAHWSNGAALSWRDFAALAHACSGANNGFMCSSNTGYAQIARVQPGVNEQQVVVTMKQPMAQWQTMFDILFPASAMNSPHVFNSSWLRSCPPTAGPFRVESIDTSTQTVTLKRNPHWWGEQAKLDRLIFRVTSESSGIEPYLSGEFNAYNLNGNLADTQRALHADHTQIRRGLSNRVYQLTFNEAPHRITSDRAVRYAIAHALDRAFIARVALGPLLGNQSAVIGNHFFLRTSRTYQDNNPISYNRAIARKYLDDAGWKEGAHGIRHKNGRSLTLSLLLRSGVPLSIRASAELMQQYLSQIGIRLILRYVPPLVWGTQYLITGDFDIAYFPWNFDNTPIVSMFSIFHSDPRCNQSDTRYDPTNCQHEQNYGLQGNDHINTLYEKVITTTNPHTMTTLAQQLDQLLWDDLGQLPLFQDLVTLAVDDRLVNYGPRPVMANRWDKMGWKK